MFGLLVIAALALVQAISITSYSVGWFEAQHIGKPDAFRVQDPVIWKHLCAGTLVPACFFAGRGRRLISISLSFLSALLSGLLILATIG